MAAPDPDMTTEPQTTAPLSAEDNAALDALRDAEARFWKAESTWADKGSGMTKEQQTGAHMAFMWLRTQRPVATRARSGLDAGLREAVFDLLGHLCDWSANVGGDRCKADATSVRKRKGDWVPVCDEHAALSSGKAAPVDGLRVENARLRHWLNDPDAYLTARLTHEREHEEAETCSVECSYFDPAWPLPAPGRAGRHGALGNEGYCRCGYFGGGREHRDLAEHLAAREEADDGRS